MSVALADNALTTLETVKTMLGIEPDDVDPQRDDVLTNLINYASAWIESMTGRIFKQQTYVQRLQEQPVSDKEPGVYRKVGVINGNRISWTSFINF